MGLNKAKVITITSVSGGVGKTTTVLNLAGMYSKLEKRTLILDLDLYSGDISLCLNINYDKDIYNLYEDINNKEFKDFNDYVIKYNDYIDVLPSLKDIRYASKIDSKTLKLILYKASMKYDIVLIDTNYMLSDINLFALELSNQILYLVSNDTMNLKNMKTMLSILNDMNKTNYKIILNESLNRNKGYYDKYDIRNILNKSVNYIIPSNFFIKNIDSYILRGEILTLNDKICFKYKKALKILSLITRDTIKEGDFNG